MITCKNFAQPTRFPVCTHESLSHLSCAHHYHYHKHYLIVIFRGLAPGVSSSCSQEMLHYSREPGVSHPRGDPVCCPLLIPENVTVLITRTVRVRGIVQVHYGAGVEVGEVELLLLVGDEGPGEIVSHRILLQRHLPTQTLPPEQLLVLADL